MDKPKALQLAIRACEMGEPKACVNAAKMFSSGVLIVFKTYFSLFLSLSLSHTLSLSSSSFPHFSSFIFYHLLNTLTGEGLAAPDPQQAEQYKARTKELVQQIREAQMQQQGGPR